MAALSVLLAAGCVRAQGVFPHGWSLSESSTNPFFVTGPPFLGEREIYVWLHCTQLDGFVEADFDLVGSLEVVSFTPLNGLTNVGTLPTVHLTAPSCTSPEFLAGSLVVRDATGAGGSLCFAGANTTRDCGASGGIMQPHGYVGYSTDGLMPCQTGTCLLDIAIPETWGRVKAEFAR